MAALAVEHPEQLSRHVEGDARDALVLSLELPAGGGASRLVIGPDEGSGPAFFACDEASLAPSMAHSVWARDFLLDDGDDGVVELLMDCACLIEFSPWRWVVAADPAAGPRYLVTARLDREFQGTRDGGLDVDELDGSLSVPELFLREVAGLLVPHEEGCKLMFHPELQVTPTRAFVPETARRWPG